MRTVAASTSSCAAVVLSGAAFLACDGAPGGDDTVGEIGAPIELASAAIEVLGTSESLAVVRDLEVLPDGSV